MVMMMMTTIIIIIEVMTIAMYDDNDDDDDDNDDDDGGDYDYDDGDDDIDQHSKIYQQDFQNMHLLLNGSLAKDYNYRCPAFVKSLGQDLAGNSFTGTVCQAKIVGMLMSWVKLCQTDFAMAIQNGAVDGDVACDAM
eukprot:4784247-Karenia_brevis.AAC.1